MNLDEVQNIIAEGESDTLELKKSTAQLRRAAESLRIIERWGRGTQKSVGNPPSDRRLREELLHLKKLGLVSSSGHGRGAAWSLVRNKDE